MWIKCKNGLPQVAVWERL